MYSYEVITKVPPRGDSGNLAAAFDLYVVTESSDQTNGFRERVQPLHEVMGLDAVFNLRKPVFHVGEILIIEDGGREIPYPGRKTSKWPGVESEVFARVEDAVARSQAVFAESVRSGSDDPE